MAKARNSAARRRRTRAKITVDFATGEVHDRSLDAGADPRAIARAQGEIGGETSGEPASERLSNEVRAQLGIDAPKRARRVRAAEQASRRRWVKARKIP
jgi:hypothetical protein